LTESEGIEMSDEMPENVAPVVSLSGAPVLRREALLPSERSRGLGTVAIVCTMAGVASGLALATTLMAMQVADSMSSRGCPYREGREAQIIPADVRSEHGFLGIIYTFHDGYADVEKVLPGTPAAAVHLRPGDHVISLDGASFETIADLQSGIFRAPPGTTPSLTVERQGRQFTLEPTLVALPTITY
jgi:S1-C subfamily serine protease